MDNKFKKALFEVVMLGEDVICTSGDPGKEDPTEGENELPIDANSI